MINFNDQSERKKTGYNGFLVAQSTVMRDENENKKQRSANKQS